MLSRQALYPLSYLSSSLPPPPLLSPSLLFLSLLLFLPTFSSLSSLPPSPFSPSSLFPSLPVLLFCETRSYLNLSWSQAHYEAEDDIELLILFLLPRSAETAGVHYHTQLMWCSDTNLGLCVGQARTLPTELAWKRPFLSSLVLSFQVSLILSYVLLVMTL